ncbi:MAG: methyltransferase domain-containing protein [Candidatus Glassbacteria bacterium]|nr:methyltransferase domain-containing protein [Candidatus Glassbacteria bacterium]
MKKIIRSLISALLWMLLKPLPLALKAKLITRLTDLSAAGTLPGETLRFLFEIENRLYCLETKASIAYGDGVHTADRHLEYHGFVAGNLYAGERVLVIGRSIGYTCNEIAVRAPDIKVLGFDRQADEVSFARGRYRRENLEFLHGDACLALPEGEFDVVTMSNVLEHIEQRVELLKKIEASYRPKRYLFRVPLFERDWRVPLKKELGLDYRLDDSHFIEYTREEFREELRQAGLEITRMEVCWGEIWSVAESADRKGRAQG